MTLNDSRNKARALGRIKRLASSGLPLEPFVRSIFELINDAVPNSPNRSFHVGAERSDAYICTPEVSRIVALHNRYFVESPPQISGARFPMDLNTLLNVFPTKTIWQQDDVFMPGLLRAEGFNEAYRPMGWHHVVGVIFHEAGRYAGYYGIWRTDDQKPFGRDDTEFLRTAAPHITHGLNVARMLDSSALADGEILPLSEWHIGVILLDGRGHPVALDAAARRIFHQLRILDRRSDDPFDSNPVREGLAYVSRTLGEIFRGTQSDSEHAGAPVYHIFHHWSGIVLKLRGVQMTPGTNGREYTAVLVERGETTYARRARTSARFGLSQREAEVLEFIAQGKTGREIATLLDISHDTARKHTSNILDKLGVETRTAAATMIAHQPP